MKKIFLYGGGYIALSIINNEVLSWLIAAVVVWTLLCKYFPIFMEGTK